MYYTLKNCSKFGKAQQFHEKRQSVKKAFCPYVEKSMLHERSKPSPQVCSGHTYLISNETNIVYNCIANCWLFNLKLWLGTPIVTGNMSREFDLIVNSSSQYVVTFNATKWTDNYFYLVN